MSDADRPTEKHQAFRLQAAHALAALEAVEDALSVSGGELVSLSLRPGGLGLSAVLTLRELGDGAAERLAERLATRTGVSDVRLEHGWMRP